MITYTQDWIVKSNWRNLADDFKRWKTLQNLVTICSFVINSHMVDLVFALVCVPAKVPPCLVMIYTLMLRDICLCLWAHCNPCAALASILTFSFHTHENIFTMFSRLKEINSGVIRLLLNLLGQLNLLQDSVSRKSYGQLRPHVAYLRIVRERVLTPQLPQLLLQELHQPQSPTTQLCSWHRRLRRLLHPSVWSTIARAERTTKNQSNFDITALSS